MRVKDLWHEDAFCWDKGRKNDQQPPTIQSFAIPTTVDEVVDSDIDKDDMDVAEDSIGEPQLRPDASGETVQT